MRRNNHRHHHRRAESQLQAPRRRPQTTTYVRACVAPSARGKRTKSQREKQCARLLNAAAGVAPSSSSSSCCAPRGRRRGFFILQNLFSLSSPSRVVEPVISEHGNNRAPAFLRSSAWPACFGCSGAGRCRCHGCFRLPSAESSSLSPSPDVLLSRDFSWFASPFVPFVYFLPV